MATEFRVLVVDPNEPGTADDQLSLQTLREAVLGHPSLALEALRYALGADAEIPGGETAQTVTHSGGLPLDTPIFKMLSPDQVALLSPAAKQLTKADLLSLQGPGSAQALKDLQLTFDDLKSVEEAFHQRFDVSGLEEVMAAENAIAGGEMVAASFDVSCCCCTPCCCCTAAAVSAPLAGVV